MDEPKPHEMNFSDFRKTPFGEQLLRDGVRSHRIAIANRLVDSWHGYRSQDDIDRCHADPDHLGADNDSAASMRHCSDFWLRRVARAAEEGKTIPEQVKSYIRYKMSMLGYPSERDYYIERLTQAGILTGEQH